MKVCPSCNTQNEDGAVFCDNCGGQLGAPAAPAAPAAFPAAPAAGGIACPSCGTQNLAGTMFCDNCGASLSGAPAGAPGVAPAPAFPPAGFPPPAAPAFPPMPAYPAAPPAPMVGGMPPAPPRLMVSGQNVPVPLKGEIVIGRADVASGWNPDVDLTPFGGTPENGVSRKHVKLVWQGTSWVVEDMNSTNRPYLRGQQLAPGQRMPLNNGDVLTLGKLQVTFLGS